MTGLDYTNNRIQQRCDGCGELYLPRLEGDMADLNNFCRRDAEEVAHQLEVDYNLPEGCGDDERQRGLGWGEDPTKPYFVYECTTPSCIRRNKTWSTQLTRSEWEAKYGRAPHCFRCGQWSLLVAEQFAGGGA